MQDGKKKRRGEEKRRGEKRREEERGKEKRIHARSKCDVTAMIIMALRVM